MCQLVIKKRGFSVDKDILKRASYVNKDGYGFGVAKNNEVLVFKGYETFEEMWSAYIDETENEQHPALIHLRNNSRGVNSLENTQPFVVGNMCLGHNGTFTDIPSDSGKSDTYVLSRLLHDIFTSSPDLIDNESFNTLLAHFMGRNKVALLKPDGEFIIFNRKLWFRESQGGNVLYSAYYGVNDYTSNNSSSMYERHYNRGTTNYSRNRNMCKSKTCTNTLYTANEIADGICISCMIDEYREKKMRNRNQYELLN